jgi:hypothetical protein
MNRPGIASTGSLTAVCGARRQSGAALFVALVMLLLIAVIGVAGIRTVVMEKNMSTNNQYQMLVFQGAESAIEGVLADADAFVAAINTATGDDPPVRSFTLDHDDHSFSMTAGATVAAGAPEVAVGFTLGDFVSYPFTVTSSSSIASINSADTHILTASKVAPYLF